ncbi:MAG: transcription factor Pcc1-domain-containing protein [Linnemannia gamsii]|nr:MAG: transcription factor Pcc1-domain-containing protein [Linnemannia gamsii]
MTQQNILSPRHISQPIRFATQYPNLTSHLVFRDYPFKTHLHASSSTLQIPLPSPRLAKIAADVLDVDKDLKPEVSRRLISTQDNILTLDFQTSTLKLLRTVVNSSLEMVQMVVSTMASFDTESEEP